MKTSPYEHMQHAVDIVGTSPHPTNKVAATIAGKDASGKEFAVSHTNYWPEPIASHIGPEVRIGNASGTLHAETACIIHSPGPTLDSALFVTDPPCPNCVKNMAEAGVTSLYIDHKGFDKDFALRRGGDFASMSMRICEKAGINVFIIYRKEKRLEPILQIPPSYKPPLEKPPLMEQTAQDPSAELFEMVIRAERRHYIDAPYAVAFARDGSGKTMTISAEPHPVIGYTSETLESAEGKYTFILQPVNRILMTAARHGLNIQDGFLYSSIVPTARELVNVIAAGLTRITIGDRHGARDPFGPVALMQLENAGILNVQQ